MSLLLPHSMARGSIALVLISSLTLAGCGRKGPLEPPSTAVPSVETSKAAPPAASLPTMGQTPATPKPADAPKTPFLLDFLL